MRENLCKFKLKKKSLIKKCMLQNKDLNFLIPKKRCSCLRVSACFFIWMQPNPTETVFGQINDDTKWFKTASSLYVLVNSSGLLQSKREFHSFLVLVTHHWTNPTALNSNDHRTRKGKEPETASQDQKSDGEMKQAGRREGRLDLKSPSKSTPCFLLVGVIDCDQDILSQWFLSCLASEEQALWKFSESSKETPQNKSVSQQQGSLLSKCQTCLFFSSVSFKHGLFQVFYQPPVKRWWYDDVWICL